MDGSWQGGFESRRRADPLQEIVNPAGVRDFPLGRTASPAKVSGGAGSVRASGSPPGSPVTRGRVESEMLACNPSATRWTHLA